MDRTDMARRARQWKELPEGPETGRNSWTVAGAAGAAGGPDKAGEADRPPGRRTVSNDDEMTETMTGQRPKQWRDEAARTAKQMMTVGMKTKMEQRRQSQRRQAKMTTDGCPKSRTVVQTDVQMVGATNNDDEVEEPQPQWSQGQRRRLKRTETDRDGDGARNGVVAGQRRRHRRKRL